MGVVLATAGLGLAAQTAQKQQPAPAHQTTMQPAARPSGPVDNPVADPKAIVTIGNARFTVLTPQLIRMEWSADGKFEDHASLVFINRRLPVPKYTTSTVKLGGVHVLEIKTDALSLHYVLTDSEAADKTAFGPENLNIAVPMGDGNATWRPGQIDPANLQGTTRTLDGARGDKTREPIEPGLVSREGWALVDDSTRPLFDSTDFRFQNGEKSPWPWVMERPANEAPGKYHGLVLLRLRARLQAGARRLTSKSPGASRCRRALLSASGGRATGPTATRSWTSWCAASARTIRRSMCW